MEDTLSSVLRFLPQVNNCCICIKDMKIATIISSILLFIFHNWYPFFHIWTYKNYHHKASAIAIIQCVVWYIFIIFNVLTFLLNIIVFFTLCIDMSNMWGLLFVFVSLLGMMSEVVWIVLAFIRHWVDPGLKPHYVRNWTKCPRTKTDKSNASEREYDFVADILNSVGNISCYDVGYYTDYVVISYLLPLLLFFYFLIVINSFYRQNGDESEVTGES